MPSVVRDAGLHPSRTRAGIALLFVAAGIAYGGWAVSVAGVKVSLGLSDGVLGATLLCVAAGAMVAMPITGWLGARGLRWLLTSIGVGLVVALPLPGFVSGGVGLAAVLLLVGASAGSLDVGMNARASRFEQERGQAVMSSFHAAFSVGGLLGTLMVAACEAVGLGFRGGLLTAAIAVGLCIAAHAWLDPDPVMGRTELEAGPGARRGRTSLLLWGIGALCLLAFLTEGAVADWSGVFLRDAAGFEPATAASGYAAFSVAMIVARLAGDAWVRRFGSLAVLQAGAAIAAVGVGLAMVVPVAGPLGFGLVGLGGANIAPILFSSAGRAGPAASTGIAAVATLGYAGMLVGPPIIGGIAELSGLRTALGTLMVALAVIVVTAKRMVR